VLLLNECLLLLLFISLSTQSENVWTHPRILNFPTQLTSFPNLATTVSTL